MSCIKNSIKIYLPETEVESGNLFSSGLSETLPMLPLYKLVLICGTAAFGLARLGGDLEVDRPFRDLRGFESRFEVELPIVALCRS